MNHEKEYLIGMLDRPPAPSKQKKSHTPKPYPFKSFKELGQAIRKERLLQKIKYTTISKSCGIKYGCDVRALCFWRGNEFIPVPVEDFLAVAKYLGLPEITLK